MCGIMGYLGDEERTVSLIYDGLRRLEYRGYDSSGISVLGSDGSGYLIKSEGKLENLKKKIDSQKPKGSIGIGHTRWATHGAASESNAHPHTSGSTSVVHNGIIENYSEIKKDLEERGYSFISETDSEVIAHLVESFIESGLSVEESVRECIKILEGSYAIAVISSKQPDRIVATRKFSPLVVARGSGEQYVSSDISAILPYTREMIFLEDGDIAVLTSEGIKITDEHGNSADRELKIINWDPVMIEKSGYRHFMLKEIYEQPRASFDTIRGRFTGDETNVLLEGLDSSFFDDISNIYIIGCGTSFHAAMIGKYMIEKCARVNTTLDFASEFRYRSPVIDKRTLVIGISQSGETADTSEALLEAKRLGIRTLGITNVELSKIARECDRVVYTRAGPEIGVASTKAFSTQITVLYLLAIFLGSLRGILDDKAVRQYIRNLIAVTKLQRQVLELDEDIRNIAREFHTYRNFIFLGRGVSYPVALEGALKLKEISYIHAEGYAAGEMKHGPIALIDSKMPVVFIAPQDGIYYKKLVGNFREIKARGGRIIFITSERKSREVLDEDDVVIEIPKCENLLSPLVTVVPLQFLAYHIANLLGTDIDQPRNLAKVVTVE